MNIGGIHENFEYLVSKEFKPKVNVMDNQATKAIKAYLTPQQVTLQLVEPHNHRVNAAERAIQTFKNRFIGALGTTDSEFPIQLWDKLAPQVQDCINLLRRSRISPNKSAHETLKGPYDWNRYPLAPHGTRAIIYKDSDRRALWASHGLDAWYLGPSKDHYRCHIYYVPETKGYRVSGSAELFPQHCREPTYSPDSHVKELSAELQENMATVGRKSRTVNVLKLLARHLEAYLTGAPPPAPEQRVNDRLEQRVTKASIPTMTPLPEIQRVSDAPPTMVANNPTSKRIMQKKTRTHQQATRRNTPGALPHIVRPLDMSPEVPFQIPHIIRELPKSAKTHKVAQQRVRTAATKSTPRHSTRLTIKDNHVQFRNSHIISQEALNLLFLDNLENNTTPYILTKLLPPPAHPTNFEHYVMPMVHPVTGETISSYKKLMKDPVTAEMWQTAFGKDFGGMCQGDDKTGMVGTDAMFVMTPQDVANMPADRLATYANIIVNFRPPKGGPIQNSSLCWRKPNQPPRGVDNKNSRHHKVKTSLEQCTQYPKGKIHVPQPQEFLPVGAARAIRIYAHPDQNVPRVDNKTIRLVDQSGTRICLLGDEMCSFGTPPGRYLGQQITAQAPCPQGILQVQADARSMAACHTPHFIHIGGR